MAEREAVPSWAKPENSPTERQLAFIKNLIEEKDLSGLNDQQRDWLSFFQRGDADLNTKQAASRVIETLMALPKKPQTKQLQIGQVAVPDGRYAIEHGDTLKFYRVDTPTEGRWAGYTFVSVQASDELYPIKNRQAREEILRLIAADVQSAMLRYGIEIGACGHCGRTLTNEESREFGIGPICRQKMGW